MLGLLGRTTQCGEDQTVARMAMRISVRMPVHLSTVTDFIPIEFTLMRPNEHLQPVFIKNLGSNVLGLYLDNSLFCLWGHSTEGQ